MAVAGPPAESAKIDFTKPLCAVEEDGDEAGTYSKAAALKELAARGITSGSLANKLCVHTLMRGCVNSFIELYKLSHRPPVCIDELAGEMFSVSEDTLPWIADVLAESEENKRHSKFGTVYSRYTELADFFEKSGDHATTISFHELGLKCAKTSSDKGLEGTAHEKLGLTHERLGNLPEAISHHEVFLRTAEAARDKSLKARANTNLIRVYSNMAAQHELDGAFEEAKEFYEKAVNTAANNGDQDAEAEAYSKLGNITVLLGDLNKALDYQKRFLLVSKQMDSRKKEGRAVRECASLQEKLHQHQEAIGSLKRALEIVEEQEDLPGIAVACNQLGQLFTSVHEHAKAVHYYKESYKVAQVLDSPTRIREARIKVGLAEGNLQWDKAGGSGYVNLVGTSVPSIIAWKGKGHLE